MRFEKALGAVKMIKDQIQYRSQSLLNLARGYFFCGWDIARKERKVYNVEIKSKLSRLS